jgi:hypothetical protein
MNIDVKYPNKILVSLHVNILETEKQVEINSKVQQWL